MEDTPLLSADVREMHFAEVQFSKHHLLAAQPQRQQDVSLTTAPGGGGGGQILCTQCSKNPEAQVGMIVGSWSHSQLAGRATV